MHSFYMRRHICVKKNEMLINRDQNDIISGISCTHTFYRKAGLIFKNTLYMPGLHNLFLGTTLYILPQVFLYYLLETLPGRSDVLSAV